MSNHHEHQYDDHQHSHANETETDPTAMFELLDLDAEVLHEYLSEVTAWVDQLAGDLPVRRVLDLGSGTGTGSFALAQRFPDVQVTALDVSAPLLDRLGAKARDRGLADRVRTVQADLDAPWPALDPVDLVWASASLHHMKDPHQVLTQALNALNPGGLLVVAELDSFPRFLPEDLGPGFGRPGLEDRFHAALTQAVADELPHLGSDWGPKLREAGFTIEAERFFGIDLTSPLPEATGRYARATLRRLRSGLDGREVNADDLAALDTLVDGDGPGSLLRRDDLGVRASRTVWVARRPVTAG
jgi:SAM-dependent methyltransferase